MDFSDKTVLVTGGTRGIGRAVSMAFARRGARVAMLYRSAAEAAEQTLSELEGAGHHCLRADVADPDAVQQAVNDAIVLLGHIDIAVNNAGIGVYHPLLETSYPDWQRAWQQTLAANLIGPANVCYCVARHMQERGGGRIVNISSRGAFRGEPLKPAYGASKAGLNSLSQSLAVALAPHNIFVGAVAPGFVNTDLAAERLAGPEGDEIRAQSPLGRVAEPEDVAHAVLFLASPGAEFATGTIIDVNGASYLRS
ncbi:MAG: SDR family oxidoreductase [Pseudohongiellaceae bacterium]